MHQPPYRKKRPPLLVGKHYAYAKLPEIICSSFFRPYDTAPRLPPAPAKGYPDNGCRPYDVTPQQYGGQQRPYDGGNPPWHQNKKPRHKENHGVVVRQADMAPRQSEICGRQPENYVPPKAAPHQDNASLLGASPMTWETTPAATTSMMTSPAAIPGQAVRSQYENVKSTSHHRWVSYCLSR